MRRAQTDASLKQKDNAVLPQGQTEALRAAVDEEIELLRERMQHILKDHPASGMPLHSSQGLENLVHDLRQANANLVIASLDASARETKATESHRRQSLFLSMLAHELRNPLAPIAMSVELLGKMPSVHPEIQSLQRILERQTAHLIRLVDDLMDANRINSGKLRIRKKAVPLLQCIEQAIETSRPELEARRQPLTLDLRLEGLWIHGDLVRLSQLFSNLLLNASKFSADRSPIVVLAAREGDKACIVVRDEGIGISADRQPFVFDLFTQGAVGEGLMAKGLGIGLSLVRTIAHLHGGTVRVASKGNGLGSDFIVTLPITLHAPDSTDPLEVDSAGAWAGHATQKLQARRVLLIDDNPDINQTLGEFLKTAGHDVDFAMDGPTGLGMQARTRYDVVCCDIGLPGMSGHEVARAVRASPSQVKLIAISGYDQPQQRDQALAAGFDHYLVKPILGEELLELIAHADA
jgi:two-component system CheB/CheR fusion protein